MQADDKIFVSASQLMPNDEVSKKILSLRANNLAAEKHIQNIQTCNIPYIHFKIGKREEYGISYLHTEEVIHNVMPTKLPHMPNYIVGVINRRGTLHAVLDLKYFFHSNITPYDKNVYIILTSANGMTIGLMADSIEGSNTYNPDNIDKSLPTEGMIKPEYIIGLHKSVIGIINVEMIIKDLQLEIGKQLK